jgi:oxaloacetate decarboxylase (Na+ extruding) subunit alpha
MSRIQIVDTTLRDGQQSLWAYRMRAEAMLPAAHDLDGAGFDAIEFVMPSAQFPRAVRDLDENPWDWVHLGAPLFRSTQLRMHGGVVKRFRSVPDCVQALYLDRMVALGIDVTRTSDPWNDFEAFRWSKDTLAEHGMRTVVNIIYSVSPRHTLEYYAQKTRDAVSLDPYRICFKDVGGLLTPETARPFISTVVANAGDVPLEFHGHCNNGFGPYASLIAADEGIGIIHTAVPPLADASSLPSVFDVVPNLRARGHVVDVDLERLARVRAHFSRVAGREDLPVGEPQSFKEELYTHQVPGGMISNLRFQLSQIGEEHRLQETLDEASRVRRELGYPIMVTPLAQFVGSQAAINVLSPERYSNVTDEVIQYALGQWGREAPTVMDQDVRHTILSRPRARELAAAAESYESPSLDEVRRRHGGATDEELITFYYVGRPATRPPSEPGALPSTYEEYLSAHLPLGELVRRIGRSPRPRRVHLSTSSGQLTVTTRAR